MAISMKISVGSIKNDAERIENLIESIPTLMNELEASMQQLAGCWEGPAWGIYQRNVAFHMEMLSDIYEYMSKYVITMQQASEDYCRTEQDICSDIRKINMIF